MARTPTAPKPGQNSALTEEEIAGLQHWYSQKVREARAARAVTKAKDDEAKEAITALFNSAKGELKIMRKDFEELLDLEDMDEADFLKAEGARVIRMKRQGLPVLQPDLFGDGPKANDTASDQKRAHDLGYKVGLKAGDRTPPDTIATFLHSDWLGGYDAGQAENGRLFILASEAKAKLEKKDAKAKPKLTAVEGGKGKGAKAKGDKAPAEPAPDLGGPTAEEMQATAPEGETTTMQGIGYHVDVEFGEGDGQLTGGVIDSAADNVDGPFTGTEPASDGDSAPVTTDAEWEEAAPAAEHPPVGEQP